jgi:hypothetical protein
MGMGKNLKIVNVNIVWWRDGESGLVFGLCFMLFLVVYLKMKRVVMEMVPSV